MSHGCDYHFLALFCCLIVSFLLISVDIGSYWDAIFNVSLIHISTLIAPLEKVTPVLHHFTWSQFYAALWASLLQRLLGFQHCCRHSVRAMTHEFHSYCQITVDDMVIILLPSTTETLVFGNHFSAQMLNHQLSWPTSGSATLLCKCTWSLDASLICLEKLPSESCTR